MKEYYGESAKHYKQTGGKNFLLFPAIKRVLPKEGKLLDVGCGNADIAIIAEEFGLEYFGFDISEDMLAKSRKNFPKGNFIQSSSTDFSSKYNISFDVIVVSMLFPAFSNYQDVVKTLEECRKVLKEDGVIIIGVTHPAYDQYMQYGLLGRENIETEFKGYFESGKQFLIHKDFGTGKMVLEDYHWTFSDYFNAIKKANLKLTTIDECPVETNLTSDQKLIEKKRKFPTYLVLVASKE